MQKASSSGLASARSANELVDDLIFNGQCVVTLDADKTAVVTGDMLDITPRPPSYEQVRFDWTSPMMLSQHDTDMLYVAGNRLFISSDRGSSWISTSHSPAVRPGRRTSPAPQAPSGS